MKKIFYLLLLIPSIIVAQTKDQPDDDMGKGVHFEGGLSWEQVKAKAKEEHKYIFVDVYASWCGPCKLMDSLIYSNDSAAEILNRKFISVKLQMDSTNHDDERIRKWYTTARTIALLYSIEALPTFLFFAPDGRLAYRDIGYKTVPDFISLANKASDPLSLRYYELLEEYRKGYKDYKTMGDLAVYVKKVTGDKKLAINIAREYKVQYLDTLSGDALLTKRNFDFIDNFDNLITVNDQFFNLCYTRPDKVNQLKNSNDWAQWHVKLAITTDEIDNKLLKNGKPLFKYPNWSGIWRDVCNKYPKADGRRLVLEYQVIYYNQIKDFANWLKYQNLKINNYPPTAGIDAMLQLNNPAWEIFLKCNEKRQLNIALKWIELDLKLLKQKNMMNSTELDTKAALLYKLGRVRDAIFIELSAIDADFTYNAESGRLVTSPGLVIREIENYNKMLNKMKKGEPTYLDEGAVWNVATLSLIKNNLNRSSVMASN